MSPLWTGHEAQHATGGRATAPFSLSGIGIDSRSIRPGEMFVALRGENHDGHDYVAAAAAAGAAAAMVDSAAVERIGSRALGDALPLLVVEDCMEALRRLAAAARARSSARIAAVTGSVGKTGTKDALAHALARCGPTHATTGNLNNHIGAPLTLARMPADAAFGVFELGMNHPGEIAPLSRLVRPHVAIVTTVEAVHIEHFSGVEGIADAKAEIFIGLERGDGFGNIAILNRDNRQFERLAGHARKVGAEVVSFGAAVEADIRLVAATASVDGSDVRAAIHGRSLRYRLGAPGSHWILNSLAVVGALHHLGVRPEDALPALAEIEPAPGRGKRHLVGLPCGGAITVIDESYNASPASMRAALDLLGAAQPAAGGRRIAVLGDMLELGKRGPDAHAGLAGTVEANAVDAVFTAGPLMAHLFDRLPRNRRGGHAARSEDLLPMATAAVRPGDVVMVKGSLGSRMKPIVDALLALRSADGRRAGNGE